MRRYIVAAIIMVAVAAADYSAAIEETPQKKPTLPVGKMHVVTVEKGTLAFTPQVNLITLGDVVRWANEGEETHLVVTQDPEGPTRELLVYKTLAPGETFEYQFERPDDYYFFCAIHFQMWGTVTVAP